MRRDARSKPFPCFLDAASPGLELKGTDTPESQYKPQLKGTTFIAGREGHAFSFAHEPGPKKAPGRSGTGPTSKCTCPKSVKDCGNPGLLKEVTHALGLEHVQEDQRTDRMYSTGCGGPLEPWVKAQYPTQEAHANFKAQQRKGLDDRRLMDILYHIPDMDAHRPRTVCEARAAAPLRQSHL